MTDLGVLSVGWVKAPAILLRQPPYQSYIQPSKFIRPKCSNHLGKDCSYSHQRTFKIFDGSSLKMEILLYWGVNRRPHGFTCASPSLIKARGTAEPDLIVVATLGTLVFPLKDTAVRRIARTVASLSPAHTDVVRLTKRYE